MSASFDGTVAGSLERPGMPVFPALVFAVGILTGITVQLAAPAPVVPALLEASVRALGFLVVAIASVPVLWAVLEMWRAGTTPNPMRATTALLTSGPFRLTRNPMYVGLLCVTAGAALTANALWVLLSVPFVAVAIYRGAIVHEERYLEARFGGEFQAFKARVPRWL